MGHLNALKFSWENEFTKTIEFFEDEVEKWLVWYINVNDELDDTLHQSEMDPREFKIKYLKLKLSMKLLWHL